MEPAKKRLIIITAAGAIGVLAVYNFLFAALIGELGKKYAECRGCEADALYARGLIESVRVRGIESPLLMEEDVSLAIDELTKKGRGNGINFVSITPKDNEKKKDARYGILPISMELESAYEDLGMFLGMLDGMDNSLVTVAVFEVAPRDTKDPTVLRTKLVINMYLLGEKYAE